MALMSHHYNCQVLIVDDDVGIREVLSGFLESRNYIVRQAPSGAAALDELNNSLPFLVFIDIYMPQMDGLQLMRIIKERFPTLKMVAMSGYATEKVAKEAMDLGAIDFLVKPIEFEHLDDILPIITSDFEKCTTS
jgi:YesN/AraC family two-component response regulator